MDQINEFQKWVGEPVVGFAQQHWWWLMIVGFLGVAWFFGWGRSDSGAGVTIFVDGSDPDGDSGGDGGGGDGGGGGD